MHAVPRSDSHASPERSRVRPGRLPALLLGMLAGGALLLPLPTPLEAQTPELRVVPSAGFMMPTSALYRSGPPPTRADLGEAPLISLGLHAAWGAAPFSVRVRADRFDWFDTKVTGTVFPGTETEQSRLFTVPTAITILDVDVLHHPYVGERLTPYVFVGLGWKDYRFGGAEPSDDGLGFNYPEDAAGGRVHYGLGLEFDLAGRLLATELAGNFNRFVMVDDGRDAFQVFHQHEIVLRLSMPIRILTF